MEKTPSNIPTPHGNDGNVLDNSANVADICQQQEHAICHQIIEGSDMDSPKEADHSEFNQDASSSDWEPELNSEEGEDEEKVFEFSEDPVIPRTEHESMGYIEDSLPIPFEIVPENLNLMPLGSIQNVIGSLIIVQQDMLTLGEKKSALDLDSVLAMVDSKIVLGRVVDPFGPVKQPSYVIKGMPDVLKKISEGGISTTSMVGYVSEHSRIVLAEELRTLHPGCDASNLYDEEIPISEQEASDDEKECVKKQQQRSKKRMDRDRETNAPSPSSSPVMPSFDSYLSSVLNLEYVPLERPSKF